MVVFGLGLTAQAFQPQRPAATATVQDVTHFSQIFAATRA